MLEVRRLAALVVLLFSFSWGASAAAGPTVDQCVDANTQGQDLRIHHKLRQARRPFELCSDPSCPAIVRADCQKRLIDLERATPTVILEAKDATGELTAVTVTMDGQTLATSLQATPVAVDPGEHEFVFSTGRHEAQTRVAALTEGEKGRSIGVDWTAPPQPLEQPREPEPRRSPLRPAGIAVGALGLVGLGLGAAFGIGSYVAWGNVKGECFQGATCDVAKATADRNTALDFATASDVAFVVGGILAATGVVLFLVAPHRVTPAIGPNALGLQWVEQF